MTRAEHMRWCKQRALEYLPTDPQQAVTSMMSDLRKHPETANLMDIAGALGMMALQSGSVHEARRFIEGFAE